MFGSVRTPALREVNEVPGLHIVTNLITPSQEQALLRAVDGEQWLSTLHRRTQHYGYEYDYRTRNLPRRLGVLPEWSNAVVDALVDMGALLGPPHPRPNQLIVNEYQPGQGISAHTDSNVFLSPIVSVSLGSQCLMHFNKGSVSRDIELPTCSAVILTGESRNTWQHSIVGRKSDLIQGSKRLRGRRVSLTFRYVREGLND